MRPSEPTSVYLDSNTLIYAITKRPGHEPIAEVLRLAEARKLTVLISNLTYVEARGWARKDPYPQDLDEECVRLLDSPHLTRVELTRRVAIRARRYAWSRKLNNYDAVHLASAVEYPADVFMTADTDFPIGTTVDGVWIDRPYEPGDPPLPFPAV